MYMQIEAAFAQFWTMDWFSSQNNNLLLPAKLTFWAGIIKQLFGQLLARHLVSLARENWYWAQLTLCPISALPCQINQILDSSRLNNCILFLAKILVYVSLMIMRTDYKPVHHAQPKKSNVNSHKFQWCLVGRELGNHTVKTHIHV